MGSVLVVGTGSRGEVSDPSRGSREEVEGSKVRPGMPTYWQLGRVSQAGGRGRRCGL